MTLQYTTEEVLAETLKLSSYQAELMYDQNGNWIGEPFILTEDERPLFETLCTSAHNKIAPLFAKNGKAEYLKYQIAFSSEVDPTLRASLLNAIVNSILTEWFVTRSNDITQYYANRFNEEINVLKNLIFKYNKL